jgi:hypothetical protein
MTTWFVVGQIAINAGFAVGLWFLLRLVTLQQKAIAMQAKQLELLAARVFGPHDCA